MLGWITTPYANAWRALDAGQARELQTLAPADVFVNYMQLSLVGGVIAAAPIIFYQLWAFISPGLYSKEKRYIVPFVLFSTGLFVSGSRSRTTSRFRSVLPFFFSLLGQVGDRGRDRADQRTDDGVLPRLRDAHAPRVRLRLRAAALHLLPGPRRHRHPMQLMRFSRWAIVSSFVVGAFVTPGPEISSQIAVACALVGLYFLSVGLAFLVAKRRDAPKAAD